MRLKPPPSEHNFIMADVNPDDKDNPNAEHIPLTTLTNSISSHDTIDGYNDSDYSRPGGSTIPRSTINGDFPRSLHPFDVRSEFGGLDSLPDVNIYQHKKTVAQGMMDLALFSANANQLRYVLESNDHPYYYPGIVLISISLIFQVSIVFVILVLVIRMIEVNQSK